MTTSGARPDAMGPAVRAFENLPGGLPVPEDDGAADHLAGAALPAITLRATSGAMVNLAQIGGGHAAAERAVLYVYPKTGRPGTPLPEGWDLIPGARGCTPESCGFRDLHAEFRGAGAEVFGLSSQDTEYQAEAAARLGLPFPLLADPELRLADWLGLPTFTAGGAALYKRLTLVVRAGRVEHVFYPVFPPDQHAADVLAWLTR